MELRVVGDLEATADLLKSVERDVGKLAVANEGERATDGGEVGSLVGLDAVAVEAEGAVQGSQRGGGDGADVTESHVVGPLEVGERGLEVIGVGGQSKSVLDARELDGDILEVLVVGNEEGRNLLERNAVKRAQESVLDVDGVGLLDTAGEGKLGQSGQTAPLNGADLGQLGEGERAQDSELVEVESVDLLEAVGAQAGQRGGIGGDQVAVNLLNTVERDRGGIRGNGNGTGESRARGEAGGSSGDSGGGRNTAGGGCGRNAVSTERGKSTCEGEKGSAGM